MSGAQRGVRPVAIGGASELCDSCAAGYFYEIDGPMLRHGLQGLEGQRIVLPVRRAERPDEGRLVREYPEKHHYI